MGRAGVKSWRGAGFSIAEVVIAVLLMAITTIGVFSVNLALRMGARKASKKTQAMFYTREAMERLKAYVTADTSVAPPAAPTLNWKLPEDLCNGGAGTCSSAQCWALESGCTHDVTQLLPPACGNGVEVCQGAPSNATLTYVVTDVTDANCGTANIAVAGKPCKQVDFQIKWND